MLAMDDDKFGDLRPGHMFRSETQQNVSRTPSWDFNVDWRCCCFAGDV